MFEYLDKLKELTALAKELDRGLFCEIYLGNNENKLNTYTLTKEDQYDECYHSIIDLEDRIIEIKKENHETYFKPTIGLFGNEVQNQEMQRILDGIYLRLTALEAKANNGVFRND